MIPKICSYIPVKSLALALLVGAAGCTSTQKNDTVMSDSSNNSELVSKSAADSLRANFEAGNTLNFVRYKDSNEYDFYDRLIKECEYDENGDLSCYYRYEYDTNGRLAKNTVCRPDGSMEQIITYEYMDNGLKRETTLFDDGQKSVCVRDSQDYVHQNVVYNADGSVERQYIYAYASDGTQIEIIYDGQGKVIANYINRVNVQ